MRDDFERDIREAMQAVGFLDEAIDDFFIKAEGMLKPSSLRPPKTLDSEVHLSKDKKERVKADGKTPFANGYSQSVSGKALRNYTKRIFENLEKFISSDDKQKFAKFVEYMDMIWIPESYSFKNWVKPKAQSNPAMTQQEREDQELSVSFKQSQLNKKIADNTEAIKAIDESIEEQIERAPNKKMGESMRNAYEAEKIKLTKEIEQAKEELSTVAYVHWCANTGDAQGRMGA